MRINNMERELWVNNDYGLWSWFQESKLSMRKFIKEYRDEIDSVIRSAIG